MPGREGHHLLRFWHMEVCFSSRGCERAAGLLLQLCESQTRVHLPGAVSPWLRGFSRPLLQGGPATGSSSAQRPCCGPPWPSCTAGRTELGLVPKAGPSRAPGSAVGLSSRHPRAPTAPRCAARRRRWRAPSSGTGDGDSWDPLQIPWPLPLRSVRGLQAGTSRGWQEPRPRGTGLAGFAPLPPRCAGGAGLRRLRSR